MLAAALVTDRLSDTTTAFEDLKKQTASNNKRKKSEEDDLGFGKKITDTLRENPVDWLEKNEKHKNLFRKNNAVFERGFARLDIHSFIYYFIYFILFYLFIYIYLFIFISIINIYSYIQFFCFLFYIVVASFEVRQMWLR